MISEAQAKRYCNEDISLIDNYELAINDNERKWDCHHRVEILPCGVYSPKDLRKFGLYLKRPACELIFMTRIEHSKLHSEHPLKNTMENRSKAQMGKHYSEEAKEKMSKAMIGNHNKPTKPILQYTKDGEFIREWAGAYEASIFLGIANSSIIRCCQGTRKSAGGFVWRYK